MERVLRIIAAALLLATLLAPATATAGQLFPDSRVEATLSNGHTAYLGLADGTSSFRFSDVKAEYLLINVYSLYCSPCQRDAQAFNEMYEKTRAMGLDGRIKFIGLAAGNTIREMEFWRKRYDVQFPLIPDEDYELHSLLGNVGTPFFVLARVVGPGNLEILFSREGAFEDEDAFFATILSQTSTDVAVNE